MKAILVQTTTNKYKEAKKIAKILLETKLAACIQITKTKSFYMWENQFTKDKEYLLNIKTKKNSFKKIQSKIKELHSYDLPEIISIDIDKCTKEYKNFIKENTK